MYFEQIKEQTFLIVLYKEIVKRKAATLHFPRQQ